MTYKTCSDCGSKLYNGACGYCHEETFIAQHNYENDDPIAFSDDFKNKLSEQKIAIRENQKLTKQSPKRHSGNEIENGG